MVELLPDDSDEIRPKLLVLDELVEEVNTLGDYVEPSLLRLRSEDDVGDVEDDSNAVIVLFVYVEQVEPEKMIKNWDEDGWIYLIHFE